MESPDTQAVRKILAVEPRLQRLELASRAIGLGSSELIHAGPPITDPAEVCRPILHSAITAALFEGWARSVEEAKELLRSGEMTRCAAYRPAAASVYKGVAQSRPLPNMLLEPQC